MKYKVDKIEKYILNRAARITSSDTFVENQVVEISDIIGMLGDMVIAYNNLEEKYDNVIDTIRIVNEKSR